MFPFVPLRQRTFFKLVSHAVRQRSTFAKRANKMQGHRVCFRDKAHWRPCVFRSFRYFKTILVYHYHQ